MRKVRIIMTYLFLIAFGIFIITGLDILIFGTTAKPKKSDCIIVLGCQVRGTTPSAFLMRRLDEGYRLYREGYGKCIIVSGGRGPGEDISEAEAMRKYLLSRGMDSNGIIMEDKSASTIENIKNSRAIMDSMGFKSAVVVSNKYHLKRAYLIAGNEGMDASCSGVFVSQYKSHEISGFLREILALLRFRIFG